MERRSVRTAATGTLLLLPLLAGCDSDPVDPPPGEEPEVSVLDNFFQPETVVVSGGETILWTWGGSNAHDVTWDAADLADSPTQVSGSHEVTVPSEPGEYGYHCTVHGAPGTGMHGTVVVE